MISLLFFLLFYWLVILISDPHTNQNDTINDDAEHIDMKISCW